MCLHANANQVASTPSTTALAGEESASPDKKYATSSALSMGDGRDWSDIEIREYARIQQHYGKILFFGWPHKLERESSPKLTRVDAILLVLELHNTVNSVKLEFSSSGCPKQGPKVSPDGIAGLYKM